jgi:alanine racemase
LRRLALLDLEALAQNLVATSATVLDARADAYGHGLDQVAPVARELGVDVLTDLDPSTPEPEGLLGAAAYGLAPGSRPVLTLVGEVVAVKRVGADAGVSYGYSYRTARPTTLALIGLGYADGVPRLASNRASVRVGSDIHPLVGRVAMDQFVVDCGDDEPELGSDALLFGDPEFGAPSAFDWAVATQRTPLALTAGLGPRILRESR